MASWTCWSLRRPAAITGVLLLVAAGLFAGCLSLKDTTPCQIDRFTYESREGINHPNDKHTQVGNDIQTQWGETVGLETHTGPLCAYPHDSQWHLARFDDEGVHDETLLDTVSGTMRFEPPAVGAYKLWVNMLQDEEVLAEGDPEEQGLTVQVYHHGFYGFPGILEPIEIEVPVVCCHAYESRIDITNMLPGEQTLYTITVTTKDADGPFKTGPPPLTFSGDELNEWLGPRFVDTLVIVLSSVHPDPPPPTLNHLFRVQLNVPDDSWP